MAGTNLSDRDIQVLIDECAGDDSGTERAESVNKPASAGEIGGTVAVLHGTAEAAAFYTAAIFRGFFRPQKRSAKHF